MSAKRKLIFPENPNLQIKGEVPVTASSQPSTSTSWNLPEEPSKKIKTSKDASRDTRRIYTEDELRRILEESEEEFSDDSDEDRWTGNEYSESSESEEEDKNSRLFVAGVPGPTSQPLESTMAEPFLCSTMPSTSEPLTVSAPSTSQNYLTRSDRTLEGEKWQTTNPGQPSFQFIQKPGLKIRPLSMEPLDYFKLIATDDLLDLVVKETNIYANRLVSTSKKTKRARIQDWKDLTKSEFLKFLAVLYMTGQIKSPDIPRLWKKNTIYDFPNFRKYFSRDRFQLILRVLHFGRNEEDGGSVAHPMYKVKPLIDLFEKRMSEIHYPNRELSLNESMVLWKGRLHFRQYMPGKKHQYGLKIYMLAQPDGLALRIHVYAGSTDPDVGGHGHTEKVVKKLVASYLGKGHALYMDNFYNSLSLTKYLMSEDTYVTGTIRANRAGIPEVIKKENIKKKTLIERYTESGICVFKWRDKRDVIIISSEHDSTMEEVTSRRGIVSLKPRGVIQYNKYMGGVDKSDQMMAYYPVERKTLRWPAKVGIHIFHLIMNNSYLIYKNEVNKKIKLIDFRDKVIEALLGPQEIEKTDPVKIHGVHLPLKVLKTQRKKCRVCAKNKIVKNSMYVCNKCENHPALCLEGCFAKFHNYV